MFRTKVYFYPSVEVAQLSVRGLRTCLLVM